MSPSPPFAYCPRALYGDGCKDTTCPLIHDAKYCKPCEVICSPASSYDAHVGSAEHAKVLARASSAWRYCSVCKIPISAAKGVWPIHIVGRKHRANAARCGIDPDLVQPTNPPRDAPMLSFCEICDISLSLDAWKSHVDGRRHQTRERHARFRIAYEQASKDRDELEVSHVESGLDFGFISLNTAKSGLHGMLTLSAIGPDPITVLSVDIFSQSRSQSASAPFSVKSRPNLVGPGGTAQLEVLFKRKVRGRYEEQLVITCQGANKNPFVITRRLRAVVGDAAEYEALKPVTPYVRRPRAPWRSDLPVVSGERPPSLVAAQWVKRLPRAKIPLKLALALKSGKLDEVAAVIAERYFSGVLTMASHQIDFARLLWIEEDRTMQDLRRYDMIDVEFIKEGKLYSIQVPGVAEKRPSVLIGDAIKVQAANSDEGRTHEGFVHDVRLETIRVSFHGSFQAAGRRYNISFQLNRVPLRRQHQALNASPPSTQRLLFPDVGHKGLKRPLGQDEHHIEAFNTLIASNPDQLQAVKSITQLRAGSAPFIIFGPPGTGKTVTAVEAIRQVLHRDANARVLVCAPSNSAADIVALRLITALTPKELFRCNAASRDPLSVPEALVPYTLHQSTHYAIPHLDTLKEYRVIVSTCGNASFAYNVGLPLGHFTHIFVDEAGQATEPEVLTAIKTMASASTRIVLSGDPKQLGPIVRSSIAREHGLGVSYMERLMERPVYDAQRGRGVSWIKLLQNYRSHQAILHYPNQKFYDNELEVCGAPHVINSFLGSPQLVQSDFPVVFHAISGHNDRESTSPSYFNIDEACEVKAYVQALLEDRSHPIHARDIGIITPYHAQVRKIRKLLRDAGIADVHVGSVDEFQGQERRVIIISTVRSSADLLAFDAKFTLGFVSNPRRFNVAVTRAQALLIVVGEPTILAVDPIWRGFMNHIYLHGGWRGDAPVWDVNAPVKTEGDYSDELEERVANDMSALMARLGLGGEGEDVEGDANVDRPFQEAD